MNTSRHIIALALAGALLSPVASCGTSRRQPPVKQRTPKPPTEPPRIASDRVFRIAARNPLHGPRARGVKGDWVVRNDKLVAVFRARDGRLVDLGFRADGRDVLHHFNTTINETRGRSIVYYSGARRVTRDGGRTHALELTGRFRDADLDLEVRTQVWAPPGALTAACSKHTLEGRCPPKHRPG